MVRIVTAKKKHLLSLGSLFDALVEKGDLRAEEVEDVSVLKHFIKDNPKAFKVAVEGRGKDARVVGYAILRRIGDPFNPFSVEGDSLGRAKDYENGYVYEVGVHPGFRRKGLAKGLLESAVGFERKKGVVELFSSTRLDNKASQKWHRSAGFKQIGVVPDFYADGVPGMLWKRRLRRG